MPLNPPDIKELKAIVDWVNLTPDVRELSIKFGDVELFVSRDGASASRSTAPAVVPAPALEPAALPASTASVAASPVISTHTPPTAEQGGAFSADSLADNEVVVKSPMVGVFYASPKPGDPPFVSVGDSVTASTVVGIVEVMKLMNSLEAKVDGTVTRILAENERAVEYGQPLMVITRNG